MGSSESELKHIITDLGVGKYFLGTFDKRFPGFIQKDKPCCAIVNTAYRETGGMHWIAFAWYPPSFTFYMFDPFGFSDEKLKQIYDFEYQNLLKRSALTSTESKCLTFIKSTESVQGGHSAACGLFCCAFLYSFVNYPLNPMKNPFMKIFKSVPNDKILTPKCQFIFKKNQDNLYHFLSQKSPYFKLNEQKIKCQTNFNKLL
ncbi:protease [Bat mastadenovirus WIV12]|uniref:Protease n=1 Tax=Bat mastadenovirus WIV12 TaxID=1788434 RepID=A0A1B0UHZ8_9ADEN|nr:protease [Bat mastadenovirus WIV12]AMB43158.1 protease [Bat mastadenovirus WIV12]